MYLNRFAQSLSPLDLAETDEFENLLHSATELGIPHPGRTRYLSRQTVLRGLRFHFTEWGEPGTPSVLVLHGGNQSGHSWDLVSLSLSDRHHVFAPDQRGHGDSEWARDEDYSIEARVLDALDFVADRRLGSVLVVGHSMGGLVAMKMAMKAPEIFRGLVVVDIGPEVSPEATLAIRAFVGRNVEFDDLEEFYDNVVEYDPYRRREHLARTVRYNMLRRADGKYVSKVDRRQRADDDPTSRVSLGDVEAIRCPVLVVRGAGSDVLMPAAAERFVTALPDGQLVTVPECGHNVHSGNPAGFLRAVEPFLSSLP